MATITWTSAVAGNWSTGSNWSGGVVPGAADDVVFDATGVGNCTVDVSPSISSIDIQSGYTGVFSDANFDFAVSGNVTLSGANASYGAGTWTVGGNWDFNSGSLSGTNVTFNSGSSTFESGSRGYGTITVNSGVSLTTQNLGGSISCDTLTVNGTYTSSQNFRVRSFINTGLGGEVAGTGQIEFNSVDVSPHGIGTNSGLISISTLTFPLTATYPITHVSGDISSNVTATYSGGGTVNLRPTADTAFLGSFTLEKPSGTGTVNFDSAANNPNITFSGNVTVSQTTGTVNWNAGTGTITLAPTGGSNVNFNGQTVEPIHVDPNAVGPILLTGDVTTSWFRDCGGLVDVNGFTLTYDNVDRCAVPYNPTSPPTLALKSGESINNGLVGWWALTDGSGTTAADVSTGGNDATLDSGAATWLDGSLGTSLDFASDRFFSTQPSFNPDGGDLTFSAWVKLDSSTSHYLVDFADSSKTSNDCLLWVSGTSLQFGERGDTDSGLHRNAQHTISATEDWFHVVGVKNGNSLRQLYFNGSYVAQSTNTIVNASTTYDRVGLGCLADSTPVSSGDFKMQNVRIWNTALTAQQVSDIYTTPWLGSNYEEVVAGNTYFFPAHFGGRL